MSYCVAVFRSKTHVLEFIEEMKNRGMYCVPTGVPAEARIGCGIAARFNCGNRRLAEGVIDNYGLGSFYSFYRVEKNGMRTSVGRI